ncbi:DNA helicase PcrA [Salininema proteolyticum]|uniref:ATP-dependent DNA helicase n=1 Tax=Salininema proteolyticum TaxID=1607685 RepID=A0ABV8U3S2_9ACTN
MVNALLDGLNEPQAEAVVHSGGPLLIVAGAGSGKTRVLTHRIAHLIGDRGAHPGEILAITFTNKAAGELRERLDELIGGRARGIWALTFHSACLRILRREASRVGLKSSFSVYDADDARRLLGHIVKDLHLDSKKTTPRWLASEISRLKNELISVEEAAEAANDAKATLVADIYREYDHRLRLADAVDFDDIIGLTVGLLRDFPAVAESWRRRFRHVLVDEYQDTNHAQYVFLRELVGTGEDASELSVVGDADQSIYAFRGATIRNILEFEKDYPNAKTVLLEQNYRSTQTILDAANAVIKLNSQRGPEKRLWSAQGQGPTIQGFNAESDGGEATWVANRIDDLVDDGETTFSEVAVFYRTNAQSRAFEEVFIRRGIPYKVVGGVRFYERKEIRDLLAYLKLTVNPDDTVSAQRVINVPKRGLGDKAVGAVAQYAAANDVSFAAAARAVDDIAMTPRARNGVKKFTDILDKAAKLAETAGPDEVLEQVLADTGYLEELSASKDPRDESRVDNIQELISVAHEFSTKADEDAENDTATFLEQIALVADSDQIPEEQGQVTLMTLHTAKGLEYDTVFLTGMDDGMFPHERSMGKSEDLEEERRLAYVGLTRARQRLFLTRASTRSVFGTPQFFAASRFLGEIPGGLVEWSDSTPPSKPVKFGRTPSFGQPIAMKDPGDVPVVTAGDKVEHAKWGEGKVVETKGSGPRAQARIDFGVGDPKWVILRLAPLTKVDS